MPARGTTLIKWGCLKLRQKSWGSDSLFFSYDITLLAGVLSPFLWTSLPLAAAVLWLQTTEISLTSAFKALCKNKLWGQIWWGVGQKELPLRGLLFEPEWILSVSSPAHPLPLSHCVCLMRGENVNAQLSIARCLRVSNLIIFYRRGYTLWGKQAMPPSKHISVMSTEACRVPPGQSWGESLVPQDLGDLSLRLLPQHITGSGKGRGAGRRAWSHFHTGLASFQLADLPGTMVRHSFCIAAHCPPEPKGLVFCI